LQNKVVMLFFFEAGFPKIWRFLELF